MVRTFAGFLTLLVTWVECLDQREGVAVQESYLHGLAQLQAQETLKEITQIMSEIKVPRVKDEIAVDAMIKEMSTRDQLDPEHVGILQNVSLLFADILDDYHAFRNEDQAELDAITAAVALCNSYGVANDATLGTAVNTSQNQHNVICRDEEEVLFDADLATCLNFTDAFLAQLSSPNCVKPSPTQAEIPAWDTFLAQGDSWFQDTLTQYIPRRNACVASSEALRIKIEACNVDQNTYESDYCQWHTHRTSMCNYRSTCYAAAVAAHNALVAEIFPIADLRTREAALIMHMQCLIQNLIVGITDHTQCGAVDLSTIQDLYNNTYPAIPPEDACTIAAQYPGHPDWYLWAYGDLSANTPAVEDTGLTCAVNYTNTTT